MHKPLELPLRVRFWHFIRGLLFYNTVYWKRASDEVNPPKLTRRERRDYQPERNLEIIRPRERPRARIIAARDAEVTAPNVADAPAAVAPPTPVRPVAPPPPPAPPVAGAFRPPTEVYKQRGEERIIKRRRYRRLRPGSHDPRGIMDPAADASTGLFRRLFKGDR